MEQNGDSVIVAAIAWIEQIFSGTAASVLATIAIASVGFMMLAGRIDVRRAITIVLGCFMVFGAASIAHGLLATVRGGTTAPVAAVEAPPAPSYPQATTGPATPSAKGHDPYAAVAVPAQ